MGSSHTSFDEFVNASSSHLLRTACLLTWDDAEAEDLVQECLIQVARRWRRVQRMDLPLAYARRILVNLALAGRPSQSRRQGELGHESAVSRAAPHADAISESLEARAELVDALARISPQQRAVLVLRYFEDLSEQQVADLLGCSIGTVKSSASRGLVRIREMMMDSTSSQEAYEK